MTDSAADWFTAAYEHAHAIGHHRSLASVLGPIEIIAAPGDLEAICWPPHPSRRGPAVPAAVTVAVTDQPPPGQISTSLESAHTQHSRLHGRGAFPLRWLPGQPWVARYDDGPLVVRNGNQILISEVPHGSASTWINRVLREVFIHKGRRHGFRLCHASIVDIAGRGLLITGPSGAGKTDLALKLAQQLPARVVTIDRGIIGRQGDHLIAGTLPFGMNIHRDTLTDLGCHSEDILRRYPPSNDKHYLSTADAIRHCRIALAARTRLDGLVQLTPAAAATQWHGLDAAGLSRTLRSSDTSDTDPGYRTDWLGLGTDRASEPLRPSPGTVGWSLRYRPDRPLPRTWLHGIAQAFGTENPDDPVITTPA